MIDLYCARNATSIMHKRKNIRLANYNYSSAGSYFITICSHNKDCLFGSIENQHMLLNEYGDIAFDEMKYLPLRFPNIVIDVSQIMPNHIHAIISIANVGAGLAPARLLAEESDNLLETISKKESGIEPESPPCFSDDLLHTAIDNDLSHNRAGASPAPTCVTIGNMVGAYKSLVSKKILEAFQKNYPNTLFGKIWQRNYYEHIIRNTESYNHIYHYIRSNPGNWDSDTLKP